jgi:hypothetical protein
VALSVKYQLSKSKGLSKILYCHGLEFIVVIHPTIHGDPILTSQAFYYLDHLECVAEFRFEDPSKKPTNNQVEYLLDNYLFIYSSQNEDSRITTKVTDMKYVFSNNEMYHYYDQGCTEALILDQSNDESIIEIKSADPSDNVGFNDWCLIENYSRDIIETYVEDMSSIVDKKAIVKVLPTSSRDGYFGGIKLIECKGELIDYHQAHRLDDKCSPRDIKPNQGYLSLSNSFKNSNKVDIPIEDIETKTLFHPLLLSYYFSGLKEINPLQGFVGFYNVLEYYFEEAPILLGKKATFEKAQLNCVLELLVSEDELYDFINQKEPLYKAELTKNIASSTSVEIDGFDFSNKNTVIYNLAEWLYSIRCAVVHSKKTRKGNVTAIFEPYSTESESLNISIPLIKWLAIKCIYKDNELTPQK